MLMNLKVGNLYKIKCNLPFHPNTKNKTCVFLDEQKHKHDKLCLTDDCMNFIHIFLVVNEIVEVAFRKPCPYYRELHLYFEEISK